jgi:hypothetical protein
MVVGDFRDGFHTKKAGGVNWRANAAPPGGAITAQVPGMIRILAVLTKLRQFTLIQGSRDMGLDLLARCNHEYSRPFPFNTFC